MFIIILFFYMTLRILDCDWSTYGPQTFFCTNLIRLVLTKKNNSVKCFTVQTSRLVNNANAIVSVGVSFLYFIWKKSFLQSVKVKNPRVADCAVQELPHPHGQFTPENRTPSNTSKLVNLANCGCSPTLHTS